ncbi:MAG: metallophosphoesterase [Victivallaceae bacterium]|nr:metallophosphoesterase [Victivallaceae bacterium]
MKVKVAVVTDLHFSKFPNSAIPSRKGEFAGELLRRMVLRVNYALKPDLVFIGGDLVDRPEDVNGLELLAELKQIIGLVEAPTIVIRGNHDPGKRIFESIIGKPPDFVDVKGIRFVPFFDADEPGCNASRSDCELSRMRKLGAEFAGSLVCLQHVPLFPPENGICPYNYKNAADIIEIMRETGYILALSGHYHNGFRLIDCQGLNYIAGRALCEKPFACTLIEIGMDGAVNWHEDSLTVPVDNGEKKADIFTAGNVF